MIDKRLWKTTGSSQKNLIKCIVCGIICGALILLQGYILADIIDDVFLQAGTLKSNLLLFVMLLIIIIGRFFFSIMEETYGLRIAQFVQQQLTQQVMDKVDRLGPVIMRDEQAGQVLGMLNQEIFALEGYFSKYLPQLFKSAMIPVLFLLFIFPMDFISGLILLVTAPLVPFFMMLIGKWTQGVNEKQWKIISRLNGYLEDVLAGITTLKLLNRSKAQGEKIGQISDAYRVTTLQVLRWAFISSLALELFTTLSIAVVSVGLGVRLVEGAIDFRYALFILFVAPEFYLPLRSLGGYFHTSLNSIIAADHIFEFLNKEEQFFVDHDIDNDTAEGFLCLEQVGFCYPSQEKYALQNISLHIREYEKIGIVGNSGSGKTTLLHLLMGFIQPTVGKLLIDGTFAHTLAPEQRKRFFSFVSQKPYIFSGTIYENLVIGNEEIDRVEVEKVATRIGLLERINCLTEGLDTKVGQGGQELSGGQKQLVAMARALLQNTAMVVMDEATANLDLSSEEVLVEGLEVLLEHKGAIIVAHRLSTIKKMDRIIVIDNGYIVEIGNHATLIEQKGRYYQLLMGGMLDE